MMTHDEMLKQIDELVSRVRTVAWISGEAPSLEAAFSEWASKWDTLRTEIESERCENCKYWSSTWPGLPRTGACDKMPARPITKPDFYCAHSESKQKKPTP